MNQLVDLDPDESLDLNEIAEAIKSEDELKEEEIDFE